MKKRQPMTKEDRQAWRDQHALITAKAAEHAQRLAAEAQADTLRQQRDKAAALLSQATATPSPEVSPAAPESASRRRPSIA